MVMTLRMPLEHESGKYFTKMSRRILAMYNISNTIVYSIY